MAGPGNRPPQPDGANHGRHGKRKVSSNGALSTTGGSPPISKSTTANRHHGGSGDKEQEAAHLAHKKHKPDDNDPSGSGSGPVGRSTVSSQLLLCADVHLTLHRNCFGYITCVMSPFRVSCVRVRM